MIERRPFLPASPRGAYLPRLAGLALACLGMASLRAQFDALEIAGLGPRLWQLSMFFTVLTNFAVVLHMIAVAYGWRIRASRAAGLLVSILLVGLVYHAVLARLWSPQGLQWWADQGLHSAMPLATLVWWLGFAPKTVRPGDVKGWMIWPLAYCAYALIRGVVTGVWAYPFLNADSLGWPRVALNTLGVLLCFLAISALVLWMAGRLRSYSRFNPS